MKNTEILVKRLKRAIEESKGIDGDFVYITIGDAKRILKLLDQDMDKDRDAVV